MWHMIWSVKDREGKMTAAMYKGGPTDKGQKKVKREGVLDERR